MPVLALVAGLVGGLLLLGGVGYLLIELTAGSWVQTLDVIRRKRCAVCGERRLPTVECVDGVWRCAACCASEGYDPETGDDEEDADVWDWAMG
jgi:hypothetical protein